MQVLIIAENDVSQAAAMLEEGGLTLSAHNSPVAAAAAAAAMAPSTPPVWPFAEESGAGTPETAGVVGVDVGESVRQDIEARQALYEQLHGASVAEHRARLRELRTQIFHAEKRQAWAEVKRLKMQVRAPAHFSQSLAISLAVHLFFGRPAMPYALVVSTAALALASRPPTSMRTPGSTGAPSPHPWTHTVCARVQLEDVAVVVEGEAEHASRMMYNTLNAAFHFVYPIDLHGQHLEAAFQRLKEALALVSSLDTPRARSARAVLCAGCRFVCAAFWGRQRWACAEHAWRCQWNLVQRVVGAATAHMCADKRFVYCITGRGRHTGGTSKLRTATMEWLRHPKVVARFRCAFRAEAGHIVIQLFPPGEDLVPPSDALCREVLREDAPAWQPPPRVGVVRCGPRVGSPGAFGALADGASEDDDGEVDAEAAREAARWWGSGEVARRSCPQAALPARAHSAAAAGVRPAFVLEFECSWRRLRGPGQLVLPLCLELAALALDASAWQRKSQWRNFDCRGTF